MSQLTDNLRLQKLRGTILQFDEVLTMSARMAAATGDSRWEERYRQFEPVLDAAIKEAISLAPEAHESESAAQTDAANLALVKMENEAFTLVRQGKRDAATQILFSGHYEEQKQVYVSGMDKLDRSLEQRIQDDVARSRQHMLRLGLLMLVAVAVLVVGWISVFIAVRTHLKQRVLAEKALRENEERLRWIAENTFQVFWLTDWKKKELLYVSPAYEEVYGRSCQSLYEERRSWLEAVHADDRARVDRVFAQKGERGERTEEEYRIVRPDGSVRWILDRSIPVRDEAGEVYRWVGVAEDITERKQAERQLHHNAFHDPLTGLPNRSLLLERLGHCTERAKRHAEHHFAVLFLDIDNFKVINDSLGHRAGDELLVETCSRLEAGLRSLDTVVRGGKDITARLGGDEFVILLEDIRGPRDAVIVAERIQEQLSATVLLGGHEVNINASIGIALSNGVGKGPEELLRDADTAMYRAKSAGKARHALFDETMHVEAMARLKLENALRSALQKEQFQILYQPIVVLDTGCINSFEALLRWNHPERGPVSPAEFIPVAEEIGLIVALGRWVLHQACRQLTVWNEQQATGPAISLSVNVSKRQLSESGFVEDVERTVRETGIDARQLNLEITESVIIEAPESIIQSLRRLRQLGVQVHMDDFGTGYSSLSCLHRFPLDVLKIDRAFLETAGAPREYAAVLHAVITLARNLNMQVTAEGIGTEDQLAMILSLDCDFAQGYYFSEPVDASRATSLLRSGTCRREPVPTGP
ncbi:MAG: putative bifunctional diguanylate cyclase/phosphodiesterase [Planctomycetota bacterium]|jgi:diguanylate cyclase (GGDEF)-like protein/PAS domain S-box-containing protein